MVNANGWLKKPTRPIRIGDLLSHTSGMRQMPQGDMKDIHWKMDHTLAGIYSTRSRRASPQLRQRFKRAAEDRRGFERGPAVVNG
jgi:CubicO group peptidase (beta-lactamase class C family)